MKTYLNKQGHYVSEKPKDGYWVSKDRSGLNVYTEDYFMYYINNKLNINKAMEYYKYVIEQGTVIKDEIPFHNDDVLQMFYCSLLELNGFRESFIKNWRNSNESFSDVYYKTIRELRK